MLRECKREVRRRAKAINFGIVYGQTLWLGEGIEISQKEAQEFIRRYFERYQGVKQFIEATIAETRKTQETRTMFGRLRQIPEINSRNPALRNLPNARPSTLLFKAPPLT
jgi:DNA polymerase-1